MIEKEYDYLDNATYERVKAKIVELRQNQYNIVDLVAEVHNLYQEYLISEEQEEELYELADPTGRFNEPASYWYAEHGCVELWKIANGEE